MNRWIRTRGRLPAIGLLVALLGSVAGCQIVAQILGGLIPANFTPTTSGGASGPPYPRRTAWTNFTVGNTLGKPTLVLARDFNLDNRPDVLVAYNGTDVQTPSLVIFFQVFQNNTITWNSVTIARSNQLASLGGIAAEDLNADGRPDVVAAGNGQIFFLRAPTDPTQGTQWQTFTIAQSSGSGIGQWQQVAIAQIDNQFQPDIIAANSAPGRVSVFFAPQLLGGPNNLTGNGWQRFDIDATNRAGAFGLVVNDVNGDGLTDVLSSAPGETNARVVWYQNPGGNATGTWTRTTIGNTPVTKLALGDLNQDGPMDLVGINPNPLSAPNANDGIQIVWYQRPSVPTTTPWSGYVLAQYLSNTPIDLVVADVEANGRLDVIAATNNANTLRWFSRRDNVTAPWVENNLADLSQTPMGISAADIFLNARPDVVASLQSATDQVSWFQNPE